MLAQSTKVPPPPPALCAYVRDKSMYTVYMIFKPREIFFNNIFFQTQFHIFVHYILTNLRVFCHARIASCPVNRTLGGGCHTPLHPPEVSPLFRGVYLTYVMFEEVFYSSTST